MSPRLRGQVVGEDGLPLACRLYLFDLEGRHFWPDVALPRPPIPYGRHEDREQYGSLPPGPFLVDLPAAPVTLRIERGIEYHPLEETIDLTGATFLNRRFELKRWANSSVDGWRSGDMHVHRSLADLPMLLDSEDLNIAFPITDWFGRYRDPGLEEYATSGDRFIQLDRERCLALFNQEWEPALTSNWSIGDAPLGAVIALGMDGLVDGPGPPPLSPVLRAARKQGALIDMEKHSWPWAPIVATIGSPIVFELLNNHVWREGSLVGEVGVLGNSLRLDYPAGDEGWLRYGFDTYMGLLACGLTLVPGAGTAAGVHPTPLGSNRLYVNLGPEPMSAAAWLRAVRGGRSFATNGPLISLEIDGIGPGQSMQMRSSGVRRGRIRVCSQDPIDRVEVVVGVEAAMGLRSPVAEYEGGAYVVDEEFELFIDRTTHIAGRVFARTHVGGPIRSAHTGAIRLQVAATRPAAPKFVVDHFVARIDDAIRQLATGVGSEVPNTHAYKREFLRARSRFTKIAEASALGSQSRVG